MGQTDEADEAEDESQAQAQPQEETLSAAQAVEQLLECILPSLTSTTWSLDQPTMGALLHEAIGELEGATDRLSSNEKGSDQELETVVEICNLILQDWRTSAVLLVLVLVIGWAKQF